MNEHHVFNVLSIIPDEFIYELSYDFRRRKESLDEAEREFYHLLLTYIERLA